MCASWRRRSGPESRASHIATINESPGRRIDMPEAFVRGVHLNYEVIGASGPFIALTPGSRRGYGELTGLARAIAARGYRVLLHARRNCGASDVAFDGSASEHEVWADDLHDLGQQLGALPMYVGGSSAGARQAELDEKRPPQGM